MCLVFSLWDGDWGVGGCLFWTFWVGGCAKPHLPSRGGGTFLGVWVLMGSQQCTMVGGCVGVYRGQSMILTLSGKTCTPMHGVHTSGWHVPIIVHRSLQGRGSRYPRRRKRAQARNGSVLQTPQMRMVHLPIGQAFPFHHVTQTVTAVTTMNCSYASKISENSSNARVLWTALVVGWLGGGWLSNSPPH